MLLLLAFVNFLMKFQTCYFAARLLAFARTTTDRPKSQAQRAGGKKSIFKVNVDVVAGC